MSWHFLERWVEKANQHSTLIGKFWITFLIVCRMVIVATVGDRVYSDEQSEFKCNTMQPGCTNVCFNDFSPISHLRFWSFQILFVTTPSVMFVIYSGHKAKTKKAMTKKSARTSSEEENKNGSEKNLSITKFAAGNGKRKRNSLEKFHENNEKENQIPNRQSKASFTSIEKYQQWRKNNAPWVESDPLYPKSTLIRLKGSCDYINQPDGPYYQDNCDIRSRGKVSPRGSMSPSYFNRNLLRNNYCNVENLNNNNSGQDHLFVWKKPNRQVDKPEVIKEGGELANVTTWLPREDDNRPLLLNATPEQTSQIERNLPQVFQGLKPGEYINEPASPAAHFPTAPPGYPGLEDTPPGKTNAEGWNPGQARDYSVSPSFKLKKSKVSEKTAKKPTAPAVDAHPIASVLLAEHFQWYVANVFVRLCLEACFTFLQFKLFGFHVPELYKCQRWPCPNTVDCFISRPTEKTIFLWFMFIYSCICVMLNIVEIIYLFYAYTAEKLVSRKQRRKKLRKQEKLLQEKLNHRMNKEKANGLFPADPRHPMADESLSSWSGKHYPSRTKHLGNACDAKNAARMLYHDARINKDHNSQDFIAILLDSEQEENVDMDFVRAEEDDLNDMEEMNAMNYEVDMTMGGDNDDADQGAI